MPVSRAWRRGTGNLGSYDDVANYLGVFALIICLSRSQKLIGGLGVGREWRVRSRCTPISTRPRYRIQEISGTLLKSSVINIR